MIYAVVHYPNVDTRHINRLRKKYDPQFNLIEPHITLMFPVPESVGEEKLVHHLHTLLSGLEPFRITLRGLRKSWDQYLFLSVQEGENKLIDLHDKIYTGTVADYRKEEIPFVPHVTLGSFAENVNECADAFEEANRLNLDYECVLDKLDLLKINDKRTEIVWSKQFWL